MGEHGSVEEHVSRVRALLADALRPRAESIPLAQALGRVTAEDVLSPVDLPLFRNSQMDGFAVRAADLAPDATLPIVGEVAARPGVPAKLAPGSTVRIMTGAVVPEGADAIVPVEDALVTNEELRVTRPHSVGDFVRESGSDLRTGERLLAAGIVLAARHLAALAAAGLDAVTVRARPRVAIITTGAELIAPGATALPGQVYDANQIALDTAVREAGAVVASAVRVVDDAELMRAALDAAATRADLILTSGGISKGDHEVVREVLEPLGARQVHLAMQPGGPQMTAEFDGVPVLSFPGNPVSTQVSFVVFLRPLLLEAAGLPPAARDRLPVARDTRSVAGKRQFLRGRLVGDRVELVAGAGSHLVAGMATADVLVDVPAETTEVREGDIVEVWRL